MSHIPIPHNLECGTSRNAWSCYVSRCASTRYPSRHAPELPSNWRSNRDECHGFMSS
jgi:hypothetical protein